MIGRLVYTHRFQDTCRLQKKSHLEAGEQYQITTYNQALPCMHIALSSFTRD